MSELEITTGTQKREPARKRQAPDSMDKMLQKKAIAAQKMRLSTPPISVSGQRTIPQKMIISRLKAVDAKQGVEGKYHYGFFPEKDIIAYAELGYEVAMDGDGNKMRIQSDICMKIPTEIYERELEAVAKRGQEKMSRGIKGDAAKLKRSGVLDSDGVQIRTEKRTADELGL